MSQPKHAAPEPSEIAGRYQVVQKLGAGAFGTVYKARDKILGRMVAIKTIRLEGLAAAGTSLDELMDRFKREAQVSAQLKHPNIVTIYDIGDADGLSYLAMEFIDGVGLDRVIANAGRLPVERAASIGAQVADALEFAHRNSVVHRDIKPANIMIEAGDRVKVTDFGIAKVMTSGDHLTVTGSLLGTPSYMSPEQARGSNLDGRSDLFSLGCVLYEMLAGKKAFRGDSITALIFKIITEEPPSIRELDPEIPEAFASIISKALAKAPETRYQSGRVMMEDLQGLTRAGSTPTLRAAETATAAGTLEPTVVHPPTVAAAAPTHVATPTLRTPPPPAGPVAPPRPPTPTAPATARSKRSSAGLLAVFLVIFVAFLGFAGVAGWYLFTRKPPTTVATDTVPDHSVPETQPAVPASTPTPPISEASAAPPATLAAETPIREVQPPPTVAREGPRSTSIPSRPAVPPPTAAPAPDETSYLDEEPPPIDGTEAGRRLAESFRSSQGGPTSSLGSGARFRPRDRSPRVLAPTERPAVAVMRHVMNAQEAFHRSAGHYGTLAELSKAHTLLLDVPIQERSFMRKGYRFDLTVEEDGFRVTATPSAPGTRPFVGDDTGIIRAGVD